MVEHNLGILIVDDDPNDLDGLKDTLSSLNLQLSTLQDPFQVVDRVKSQQPDLVLLDALLPGLSGFDLCKQIKTLPEGKDTIVLILTGVYLKDHYRREALNQFKADGFLTKPYRTKDLQRLVVRLLAKKLKITPKKLEETIGLTTDVLLHSEREKKPGWLGRFFGRWKGESAPSGFLHTVPTPPKHRRTAKEPFPAAGPIHESAVKSEKTAEARKDVPSEAEAVSRMEPEPDLEPRLAVEVHDKTPAEAEETAAGTEVLEPESPEASAGEELADAGEEEPLSSSADVMTVIMPEPSSEAPDEEREPESITEEAELEPPEEASLDEGPAEEEKTEAPPPSEPATEDLPVAEDAEQKPPEPPEEASLDEGPAEEEKAEAPPPSEPATEDLPVAEDAEQKPPEEGDEEPPEEEKVEPEPPSPSEPATEDLVVGIAAPLDDEPPEGEKEEQPPQPVKPTAEDAQEPVGPTPEEPLTTEPTDRRDVESAAEDVELKPPEGPALDDELPEGEKEEYPLEPTPSARLSETDESNSDAYILHPPEETELDIQAARSIFETIQDTLEDTQESIRKITGEEFEPKVEIVADEPTVEAKNEETTATVRTEAFEAKDEETTATIRTQAFEAKDEETTATIRTQAVEAKDEETTVTVRSRAVTEAAESPQEAPSRSEVDAAPDLGRKPFAGLPIYEEEDFLFELKRQLMMCKRVGRSFTLIVVRIADLGQIAELFGKESRAKVFLHVAEQSVAALREVDMVGLLRSQELIALTAFASERYGGDRIISRLKVTLKRNPFSVGENIPPFVPKLHFGMATYPTEVGSLEELLERAKSDVAL